MSDFHYDFSVKSGASPGRLTSLNVQPHVFLGGMDDITAATLRTGVTDGLTGCVIALTIQGQEYRYGDSTKIDSTLEIYFWE